MLGDFFLRSDEKSLEMVRSGRQRAREIKIKRRGDNKDDVKSRRGDDIDEEHNDEMDKGLFSDEEGARWNQRTFSDGPLLSSSDRLCLNMLIIATSIFKNNFLIN